MYSRSCFRMLFGSQCVNGSQTLKKSARKYFYFTFSSFWHRSSFLWFFLVRSEIPGLFFNPSTPDAKYSGHNKKNLQQLNQIALSEDPKTFPGYFVAILDFE